MFDDIYDKEIQKVFKFLDTIDLKKYIDKYKGWEIFRLMNELEDIYPYTDDYSESLFDCVSEYEFSEYINNRYKDYKVYEQTTIKYIISEK